MGIAGEEGESRKKRSPTASTIERMIVIGFVLRSDRDIAIASVYGGFPTATSQCGLHNAVPNAVSRLDPYQQERNDSWH